VHPGVYLKELLDELGLSQHRLAQDIGVPPMRISQVVTGKRPVTAELALRLSSLLLAKPAHLVEPPEPVRHGHSGGGTR
jgi:addiction module HigA family antidote